MLVYMHVVMEDTAHSQLCIELLIGDRSPHAEVNTAVSGCPASVSPATRGLLERTVQVVYRRRSREGTSLDSGGHCALVYSLGKIHNIMLPIHSQGIPDVIDLASQLARQISSTRTYAATVSRRRLFRR